MGAAMTAHAEQILSHVMYVRDDLDAGRLSAEQAKAYAHLGRQVDKITRAVEAAPDQDTADALWETGARMIDDFLTTHFPLPRAC